MAYVDLHLHTNHSDGSDAPARVVERAVALGISAVAITDHDAVSGVAEAREAARRVGIGFLTGTEISTTFEGHEVHVVGLGIDIECLSLLKELEWLNAARNTRAERVVTRLGTLGIPIELDRVRAWAKGSAVSRMHIAAELHAIGVTRSTQEGFERFLNAGKPAYVPKALLPVERAVEKIHEAGGLAFLAHPGLGKGLRRLLPRLFQCPFDGIEAYHVSHSAGDTGEFLKFAETRKLVVSGGSDCHGTIKGAPEMGKVRTPEACYEQIVQALTRH